MHFLNHSWAVTRTWLQRHHLLAPSKRRLLSRSNPRYDVTAHIVRFYAQSNLVPVVQDPQPLEVTDSTGDRAISRLFRPIHDDRGLIECDHTGSAAQHPKFAAERRGTAIMPMRDRDLHVMAEFFENHQLQEIEADITQNLRLRWPEPCWDAEPCDFFRHYL